MVCAKLIEYSFFRPRLKESKASLGRKMQNLLRQSTLEHSAFVWLGELRVDMADTIK